MTVGDENDPPRAMLSAATLDVAIRLGVLGLLGYWSLQVIAPLLTVLLWSAILAVALDPLFEWTARFLGRPRLAALLVTSLTLIIVIGPVAWLGFGVVGACASLVSELDAGALSIPLPDESVKGWPLIGEQLYRAWSLVAADMRAALVEVAPQLKPLGHKLLDIGQSAILGLLELLVSIVIAGFLFNRGPQLVDALGGFVTRVLSDRGKELVQLTGATIRNISRGVVGVALLQSMLAGIGFLAAGIRGASVFAFVALLLGIVQIGPAILLVPMILWSWTAMDTMKAAVFTAYMVPVGLIDNVLRPILMARGLTTPMLVIVIGVIGGIVAYGIVGLFFGPIVLSVAWAVIVAWVQESDSARGKRRSG